MSDFNKIDTTDDSSAAAEAYDDAISNAISADSDRSFVGSPPREAAQRCLRARSISRRASRAF